MNILRRYKIHNLIPSLTPLEIKAISTMENIFSNLTVFHDNFETYYFNDKNKLVMRFNLCCFILDNTWNIFVKKYSMKHSDICEIMKYIIVRKLKINFYVIGNIHYDMADHKIIERAFKKHLSKNNI